jgi:para-nitrobenzyl esterase
MNGWSGMRGADRFGPAPMQTVNAVLGERLVGESDEDCLSLNVWTPALDNRGRPVLVWFHGGASLHGVTYRL